MSNRIYLFILISSFIPCLAKHKFSLGCWVPYWKTETGTATARHHFNLFDQISCFSLEVRPSGALVNTMKPKEKYWHDFRQLCKRHNKPFIPTIYWTKTTEMHAVLSDKKKRDFHRAQIVEFVLKYGCSGININYEKVSSSDREGYMSFIQQISDDLHARGLVLHCTMGGRTSDNTIGIIPPHYKPHPHTKVAQPNRTKKVNIALHPGTGPAADRYKKLIARCCDQIIIMGYDEWGRPFERTQDPSLSHYLISHSSHEWTDQIIRYALTFVPPHKLVLGIPTYGLEFAVFRQGSTFKLKKRRNVNFTLLRELFTIHRVKPVRSIGGELCFTYKNKSEERYVCYLDSVSLKGKIDQVKKYNLKGMYIFTINGNEDPALWKVLEQAVK